MGPQNEPVKPTCIKTLLTAVLNQMLVERKPSLLGKFPGSFNMGSK
jgi:hypothetical protein